MKKIKALLLITITAAFMAACGNSGEPAAPLPTWTPTVMPTKTPTTIPAETPATMPGEKPTTMPAETPVAKPTETPAEKPSVTATVAPEKAATTPAPEATDAPKEAKGDAGDADEDEINNNTLYSLMSIDKGMANTVFLSLSNNNNNCTLSLPLSSSLDDYKKGTYSVENNKLTVRLNGYDDIVFDIKKDTLVFDIEATGKAEITERITLEKGATFIDTKKLSAWDVTGEVAKEDAELISRIIFEREAQVVRTNGYVAGAKYPRTVLITSHGELEDYYNANNTVYDLGRYDGDAGSFIRVCDVYGETFFEESNLLLILLESGTGSARYVLNNMKLTGSTADISVNVLVPEVGTSDMAEWHMIVPVKKNEINKDTEINVEIMSPTPLKGEVTKEVNNKMKVNMKEVTETKAPGIATMKAAGVGYGKVTHFTYESKTTGLTRGANILLPADYDASKEYPVLYFLHGIFGDENSIPGDNSNKVAEITANLRAQGYIEDIIVVFPNMFAKTNPNAVPAFSAEGVWPYDNFINDLVNDLIPYVEANYSVKKDREHRGLIGFSMGGRETLFIGTRRSDLFSAIGCIAPAPGVTPGQDGFMSHVGQLSQEELVVVQQDKYPLDMLMICCGTVDGVVGKFPESYHNIMTKNGVDHLWYEVPGANHDNEAIKSGYYNYLVRWGSLMAR